MRVIHLAASVEHLIKLRLFGVFDVYDREPVPAIGDIGIGARDVELVRVAQAHHRLRQCTRMLGIRKAHDFHPIVIGDKGVEKLDRHGARILQESARKLAHQPRLLRLLHIHHGQSARGADIHPVSGAHAVFRPGQAALRIELRFLRDEVILRIAIEQRTHVADDKPELAVADKCIAIPCRNRLLLILLVLDPHRVIQQGARKRHRRGKWGAHIGPLPERRDRRRHNPFAKILLVNIRDIEHLKPSRPVCRVKVFAAQGHVVDFPGVVFVGGGELSVVREMLGIVPRVGVLMHRASYHRLRLIGLGPDDAVQSLLAADPRIAAKEIHRPGAKAEQLGYPRIVILRLGQMAVGAVLGRPHAAGRVRKVRIESLAAITIPAHRLLLRIDPVPVLVLRADDHRARGSNHREPVLLHRAINAKHEHIVAHDLRVIGCKIAIHHALILVQWHALVCLHRKVTAKATRRP